MSSILGLSERDPVPVVEPEVSTSAKPMRKRVLAALLSSIVPGAGQLLLGHVRAGAFFLSGFVAVLMLFWPVRVAASETGLGISALMLAAVSLYAVWDALRSSDDKCRKGTAWWLLLFLPLGLLGMEFEGGFAIRASGFRAFNIPSRAMEKTLIVGDHIVVDTRYYRSQKPRTGELVIFHHDNLWVVKRVIGVEGDAVFGKEGLVYVNGNLLDEPYVQHTGQIGNQYAVDFGPIRVPAGQIFTIGDNRDVSWDSRQPQYGPVYVSDLLGKPLYIYRSREPRRVGSALR